MKNAFLSFFVLAAAILIIGSPAYAGWVEVDSRSGTTYISEGKLKNVPEDNMGIWSVFDAKKGTITLVNPSNKTYTEFDVEKFCDEMKTMMGGFMSGMTPEQRAMMKEMMGRDKKAPPAPLVSISKNGAGGNIAGYKTVKYTVNVNGRPYKDVWLATGAPIVKDVRKFIRKAMEMSVKIDSCTEMGPGVRGAAPETSDEYMGLMDKGWTMKEVNRLSGEVEAEITRLEKMNIPASEFQVPAGFTLVGIKDIMGGKE